MTTDVLSHEHKMHGKHAHYERWRLPVKHRLEVVDGQIPDEAPILVQADAAQCDISGPWDVGHVQPDGDVSQSGAFNFVKRRRIPES